jgi:hypothetical protein
MEEGLRERDAQTGKVIKGRAIFLVEYGVKGSQDAMTVLRVVGAHHSRAAAEARIAALAEKIGACQGEVYVVRPYAMRGKGTAAPPSTVWVCVHSDPGGEVEVFAVYRTKVSLSNSLNTHCPERMPLLRK